ncbi:NAD(P)-binding protein [Lophium mytilinum]|uniref:NAD(P)-binding protein n=1 Tax=Lophium mytilinum TaxID=390894 RepID=A0A6A6QQ75_9PEZI|nr:NAD(P)-binding protein [Lophium mytilinum]
MAPNKSIIFQKTVDEVPIPGTHLSIEDRPIDLSLPPPDGGLLLKNYYLSVDPYMRTRMEARFPKFYVSFFDVGEPIHNGGVAKVLKSRNPKFAEGDVVYFFNDKGLPFQEYTVCDAAMAEIPFKVENPYNVDVRHYVGALGLAGLTAYGSLYEIGKPKAGETILVSAASGAVGQLVGQLAKKEGLRVLGSVGSDEKLKYIVDELGFDGGFNYKTEEPRKALKRLALNGVDIYYDNVGGPLLEAALGEMNLFGRVVSSGMICDYNKQPENRYGVKSLRAIYMRRITFQGFICIDENILKHFPAMQEAIGKGLADGSIKFKQDITVGIENAIGAFLDLLNGGNNGKALVQLADLDVD